MAVRRGLLLCECCKFAAHRAVVGHLSWPSLLCRMLTTFTLARIMSKYSGHRLANSVTRCTRKSETAAPLFNRMQPTIGVGAQLTSGRDIFAQKCMYEKIISTAWILHDVCPKNIFLPNLGRRQLSSLPPASYAYGAYGNKSAGWSTCQHFDKHKIVQTIAY